MTHRPQVDLSNVYPGMYVEVVLPELAPARPVLTNHD